MYGLTIYEGKYSGNNNRFLELLFGHKHKRAIRIIIDFKQEKVVKIVLYQKQAGLNILNKVLLRWDLKLTNKVVNVLIFSWLKY